MSYRHFETESRDEVTVIKLHDPHLFNDFGDLHKELHNLLAEEGRGEFVVDFSATSYCPSAVVSALLMLQKDLSKTLKLCNLNAPTHEAITALGLDRRLFKIFPTTEDAVTSFSK